MPESASKNAKTEHLINITQSEPREGRELDSLNFDGENYSTFFERFVRRIIPGDEPSIYCAIECTST